jgi:D-alanyl-D-alanine carboxypeptidase
MSGFALIAQQATFPAEKEVALKALFAKYLDMGIPGLAMSVYSESTGMWSYAAGYANKERELALSTQHVHYLQSVSKTYMAVAILKLYEQGKIDLDATIDNYLDTPLMRTISGADKVTVRMLLNHTSGLPEYNTEPRLVSKIIQHPTQVLSVEEMLRFIEDLPMEFDPGTQYAYCNTNYELLSLIADKITGDHVAYINKVIIDKLKLNNTIYLTKDNYLSDINLVDSYWDILLTGIPVNVSLMQKANVASMKGDDGLVASTEDAVRFLKGLAEGKLLKAKTLEMMQEWVTDDAGKKRYGLGLTYYDLDITYAIGHNGGGIGAGCMLLYLPEYGAIVFVATNFNTMMDSPIRRKAENLQTELLLTLFAEAD